MEKEYKFTQNWFNNSEMNQYLSKDSTKKNMLEIGAFEGLSTIWFLENILQNDESSITCIDPWTTYSQNNDTFNSYNKSGTEWDFRDNKSNFLHNISVSGFQDKTNVIQGYSNDILPKLISENKKFDIIFIDGNHTSSFVLTDAVMSWYLLEEGGIMIFDDYLWGDQKTTLSPKIAVDSFLSCFSDYIEIVWSSYTLAIKKIK